MCRERVINSHGHVFVDIGSKIADFRSEHDSIDVAGISTIAIIDYFLAQLPLTGGPPC